VGACYKCGAAFVEDDKLAKDAVCVQCSSWLHSCANCLHYDEYSHNKCREPKAAFVFDRLGRNECTFFKVKRLVRDEKKPKLSPRAEKQDRERSARDELEKLFKK